MVKLAKAANKQTQKKKAAPPPKKVEEESSEEEGSDEEETPPPKVAKKATPAVKNGTVTKKAESDEEEEEDSEESSEEEAPPPKKAPAKATPAKTQAKKATPAKAAPAKAEESEEEDDEDDDDESEEEAPPPKRAAKAPAKPPAKAQPAKESSDEDEDDDEDESEEEAPPPKKVPGKPAAKAVAKAPTKAAAKAAAKAQESDDDDDEEDDSEEEMDVTPAPATKAKKAGMVKAKEESEEEDDDEDEDEEDDEEEDDDEEEPAAKPAKRKADSKKETPPAKKAKSDNKVFCLFVGNLNSMKESEEIKDALTTFFGKNDLEVVEIRLGGSRKFGYVDFESEEDLNKALELSGKKVLGQEVKLDRARSKGCAVEDRKDRDARTLFVKNIPFSATVDDLKEVFENAVEVRLPPGVNNLNRGIAYFEFETEAEAERMMEEAQGAELQGRSIIIDYVGEKSQKGAKKGAAGVAASKTLVVNNLSFSATEEILQYNFEKAVSIRIPQRDGRPKGFAFVEFESTDDAKEALENRNNSEIEGRTIRLEFSQTRGGGRDGGRGNSGPTKTLFVKGLSEDTTDETLRESFDGAVGARIVTDRDTGSSKGFGFVDFDNEDDCKAAKEAMEDGEIDGSKVTLDYAKPKGEGGFRGGRGGGGGGGRGGFRGGRGGFGGRGGGRGGGGRGGRGGGRGGFGGGRGGGGFGAKPQGKKIKFDY